MMASLVLSSRSMNNFSTERFWPKLEHRQAWEVMAQIPAGAAVSAHDRYVAHLSMRPLVFVFPVGLDKADHLLVYARAYPWRSNPEVVMKRDGDTVIITNGAGGPTHRYQVVAARGPHLLLRRL
jgi:carbamoylphosphate synthase small subunit